jgi:Lrp/AsnC family leucine-responsive transcriptional regulator
MHRVLHNDVDGANIEEYSDVDTDNMGENDVTVPGFDRFDSTPQGHWCRRRSRAREVDDLFAKWHLKDSFEMDSVDWEIIELLQRDGRMSIAHVARELRMSPPSVAGRIKRLEKASVIVGYHADVDAKALGFPIIAFVRLHLHKPDHEEFVRLISEAPEVRECFQVAEPNAFQVKVTVRDIEHLRRVTLELNGFGNTVTSLVLSRPLKSKVIDRSLRHSKK